jgi:hypothetical protein
MVIMSTTLSYAGNNVIDTVAGKLQIIENKSDENFIEYKMVLGNETILEIPGFDLAIESVQNIDNMTVVVIGYATGGNHCESSAFYVIALYKNGTYKVSDSLYNCSGDTLKYIKSESDIIITYKNTKTDIIKIICDSNGIKHNIHEILPKTLTNKDYKDIYDLYNMMCSYDADYRNISMSKYELSPCGSYQTTFDDNIGIIKKTNFKDICYMRQAKKSKPLKYNAFVKKLKYVLAP